MHWLVIIFIVIVIMLVAFAAYLSGRKATRTVKPVPPGIVA